MKDLRTRLEEENLDAIFLANDANIRFVTKYTGTDSFVLLFGETGYFLTDYRYSEQAEEECTGFEVITVDRDRETLEGWVAKLARKHGARRIGFEKNHLSFLLYEKMVGQLADCAFVGTEDIVESCRYVKTDEEVGYLRRASAIADQAFADFLPVLQPGITEIDALLELEMLIRRSDADDIAFPVILVSGVNSSKPHGIPGRKKLETGDLITIDFGAMYKGYRSDMTRTVILGEPDQKQQRVYDIVREAQQRGLDAIRAGVSGIEVNAQVEEVIQACEFAEFGSKGIGHGVGLDIHEKPFINLRCTDILQKNCVLTMEPGLYIPSWGGVRIEDTVLVTESGCEILSNTTKELIRL